MNVVASIDPNELVSDIVSRAPVTSRVFESHQIEYCCGGRVPLHVAVAGAGLSMDDVVGELNAAISGRGDGDLDWSTMDIPAIITRITDVHHAALRDDLPRLAALVEKVARVHGDSHPELIEARDLFTAFVPKMLDHTQREEQELFPLLVGAAGADAAARTTQAEMIGRLEGEHDDTGQMLARLRELLNDFQPPFGACTSYRAMLDGLQRFEADMHVHVHEENHVLFPRVMDAIYG